jgi:hypothetical protein
LRKAANKNYYYCYYYSLLHLSTVFTTTYRKQTMLLGYIVLQQNTDRQLY